MEEHQEIKDEQNLIFSIMGKPGMGKVTTTRMWLQEQLRGRVTIIDLKKIKGGH